MTQKHQIQRVGDATGSGSLSFPDGNDTPENSPFERPSQAKKRARSIAKLFDGRKVNRFVWRACCPACNSRTLEICLGADGAVTIWCAALRCPDAAQEVLAALRLCASANGGVNDDPI